MSDSIADANDKPAWHETHGAIRNDAYVLLAALLTGAPSEKLLDVVTSIRWKPSLGAEMQQAMISMADLGTTLAPSTIIEQYQRIFVGLGAGELVPYGSWYLEGTIQSRPLAAIRADLKRLGISRRQGTYESEDHAGALCETMALLSTPGNGVEIEVQADFFHRHMAPWIVRFCKDLQAVRQAPFYSAVGRFALSFLEEETRYFEDLTFVRPTGTQATAGSSSPGPEV